MLANEQTVIELHSEDCRCHGYGWSARLKGRPLPTSLCREGSARPEGAVWVESSRWLELGMPRTAEQYYFAEFEHGNVLILPEETAPV